MKKSKKNNSNSVSIIIIIILALLSLTILISKLFLYPFNKKDILKIISTNNIIPKNMWNITVWYYPIIFWIVWNIKAKWNNSIVYYNWKYTPHLKKAFSVESPIMIVDVKTNKIFIKNKKWNITWTIAAEFKAWYDWNDLENIKNLFNFNKNNNNNLIIKKIELAWMQKMNENEKIL